MGDGYVWLRIGCEAPVVHDLAPDPVAVGQDLGRNQGLGHEVARGLAAPVLTHHGIDLVTGLDHMSDLGLSPVTRRGMVHVNALGTAASQKITTEAIVAAVRNRQPKEMEHPGVVVKARAEINQDHALSRIHQHAVTVALKAAKTIWGVVLPVLSL